LTGEDFVTMSVINVGGFMVSIPDVSAFINLIATSAQQNVADFLRALIAVYSLCIVAWIVFQLLFSLGMRLPYTRWSNGVLDFLRDVSEPYIGLFRRLPLRYGAFDFSPIVALLALNFVGVLIVSIIAKS
jgi:YggT family protein